MADISVVTNEEYYSGSWQDIQEIIRVLNIGEGKMARVTQPMVNNYQEMVDRDIDAILQDTYQTPIRAFNQVVQGSIGGTTAVPGWAFSGTKAINSGDSSVTISGQAWSSVPDSIIVSVVKPAGGFNLYAAVREETVTTDGFVADLSASTPDPGYSISFFVSKMASTTPVVVGATRRVFPGDVRRAARYWTAGQLLIAEFQQLEANITEQATQMVSDARMQVYAFSRPNHRIPGQRRKSNISRTMPPNLQPSAFPERPS